MKCHMEGDVLIPGCMGTAAAMGCGKTLAQILSCCTCPDEPEEAPKSDFERRIDTLEQKLDDLIATVNERLANCQKVD